MKDPYDQGRNKEPNPRSGQAQAPEADPILALRGVGKELWRDLGGGENFTRELHANWYGPKATCKNLPLAHPQRKSARGEAYLWG
jgi:hypothetical protein